MSMIDKNCDDDIIICRCEEITKREILEAIRSGCHDLDSIKRATRAGMGMCQSKSCSVIITRMIREETGQSPDKIEPFTKRSPLRPIKASALNE